jgi:hypothetical protein
VKSTGEPIVVIDAIGRSGWSAFTSSEKIPPSDHDTRCTG